MRGTNQFRKDINIVVSLLKHAGVRISYVVWVAGLAGLVALLSLYSVGLLLPLAHALMTGSFSRILALPGLSPLLTQLPLSFSEPAHVVILLIVILYVLAITKTGLQYVAQLHAGHQARKATATLRTKLFAALVVLSKPFYDTHAVSSVHHTFMKLPQVVETQFRVVQRLMTHAMLLVVYLLLMSLLSMPLTLLVVLVLIVLFSITHAVVSRIRAAARDADTRSMEVSGRVLDLLLRMTVVQGFVKGKHELNRFTELSDDEANRDFQTKRFTASIEPIEELATVTAVLAVALGAMWLLGIGSIVSIPTLVVFLFLTLQVLRSGMMWNTLRASLANAAPVVEQVTEILQAGDTHTIPSGDAVMPELQTGIELRHLSFTHSGSADPVLRDISAVIPKGGVIALVGRTGSGKSTLANLLLRFYDCPPDTIFVDGVDIRTFSLDSVRERMSFVYQDPLLFTASLVHNATYASNGKTSDAELKEVFEKLQLASTVVAQEGVDTLLGDDAPQLSGGQKKLVALVRATLKEHDVLILDEATNALDARTEQAVLTEVLTQARVLGKTVLIISHRLATIRHADSILYLEDGCITETGTFDELVERRGNFFEHVVSQGKV
jgi:subfamily B ATP-binding cassette protein MsbA